MLMSLFAKGRPRIQFILNSYFHLCRKGKQECVNQLCQNAHSFFIHSIIKNPYCNEEIVVNPENEDTFTKKGSWWLTGLKFINGAQHPFLNRGLSCNLHFRERPALNHLPPALNHLPPAQSFLPALSSCLSPPVYSCSWNPISIKRTGMLPDRQELCSYILISIFTDQSQQLQSKQSGQCFLDQSDCEDLEFSFPCRKTNQGLTGGDFFLYESSPL